MDKNQLEIEKKYLLKKLPILKYDKIFEIVQYYTPTGRYRIQSLIGTRKFEYFHTVKTDAGSPGACHEEERTIFLPEFVEALATATKAIRKTRHIFYKEGKKWEVDDFAGLSLIVAEHEVEKMEDLGTVVIPEEIKPFVLLDVTDIKEFKNFHLAEAYTHKR